MRVDDELPLDKCDRSIKSRITFALRAPPSPVCLQRCLTQVGKRGARLARLATGNAPLRKHRDIVKEIIRNFDPIKPWSTRLASLIQQTHSHSVSETFH